MSRFTLSIIALGALSACSPSTEASAPAQQTAATAAPGVTIQDAWCRAAPPAAPSVGCFVVLTSSADDQFVAVASPLADHGEIHTMSMDGGVMVMRPLPDGLALPAGAAVTLKPGAEHIMLIAPKRDLVVGETIPLTLTFQTAAPQTVEAQVRALAVPADAH